MKKYKYSRKEIKNRLDNMEYSDRNEKAFYKDLLSLADKPKITNSGLINKNQTTSGLVDKPKEECKHKWQIGPTTNYEVQCKKCGALKPKPEIELPKNTKYLNSDLRRWVKEVTEKLNLPPNTK